MEYWREELKNDPVLYRTYANLLDASENNIPAFEREVRRQGMWDEYQQWRKAKNAQEAQPKKSEEPVAFSTGKKIINSVTALFKGV